MSDETPVLTPQVAVEIHAATQTLAEATRRRTIIYSVLLVFMVGYMGWAYSRIRPFTDPIYVADTAVEIAAGQIPSLIDDAATHIAASAPDIVKGLEAQLYETLHAVSVDLREQINQTMNEATVAAMTTRDQALEKQLRANPDILVQAAKSKEGGKAFQLLLVSNANEKLPEDKNPVVTESLEKLKKVRDHLKKLAGKAGLSPEEQTERKFLVALLANVPAVVPSTK